MASKSPAESDASRGTALVTGGARRIGRAIAVSLARKGFDIALHYHSSRGDAEEVAREVEKSGRRAHLFRRDFNNPQEASSLLPEVGNLCPDCNLLVNNASIFERGRLIETDERLLDSHFNINFRAPFFLSKGFARLFGTGQIINILDTRIAGTGTDYFVYTLTKKALHEFTLMAARELAPRIRVNAVCPGLILPPPGQNEDDLIRRSAGIPMRRRGDTESLISGLHFLIDNDFVTGECLFIDGGEHLE